MTQVPGARFCRHLVVIEAAELARRGHLVVDDVTAPCPEPAEDDGYCRFHAPDERPVWRA